ncbi:flavin reductase (DIM6/NTAB) family NADH-FMN oxidoreductase RutF [Paraburkholderia sp. GAS206C]|jgi:flavin reductase (DIM6/NTAB) family NADH-FMN oxidoreductase RutF|uniref:NADH-FMN oxidoreductase RutF, flavin reductase (DIM6/NTAB) family n=2 Tax=Burkholderiaceae TaxID=119060 RepID=A0A1N6JK19_9BURK|nr:NADH-FMN oxidoreductase RutF, flavin reductase (DIM6/NTAB) family [Paraburkholderia phenazinium]
MQLTQKFQTTAPSNMNDTYFYDPATGHGLKHDPFKAIVAPRLIGWISTRSAAGHLNLAPYSFFGAFATFPAIIGFCSEGRKDSIGNIEETGEFVWNLATKPLAEQMNRSSAPVAPEVDEFQLAGLTPVPGRSVSVPHVGESPAALECKLLQIVRLNSLDGTPMDNYLALGQVVGVHIQNAYLKDGLFDTHAAQPIMRAGYRADYAQIGEMFQMIRPTA